MGNRLILTILKLFKKLKSSTNKIFESLTYFILRIQNQSSF